MDLVSALIILILALLAAVVISQPFSGQAHPAASADELATRRSALLAEKERLLRTLQELDFDQALGKVPAEDYPQQRSELLARSADVLKNLDAVEASLARQQSSAPASAVDTDLEALIANRRRQRQERSGGFCPSCGHALQRSDKFCPECGKAVQAEQ